MANYASHIGGVPTQTERAHPDQIRNAAGGFVYRLDLWKQLERWLILGGDGGTYYASEKEITRANAKTVEQCLATDAYETIQTIVRVSTSGKAPKNDPAIFALAIAASSDNVEIRKTAMSFLPVVCRTGTHLFHFVDAVNKLRGWSSGLRRGVGAWYMRDVDQVAFQAVKYQQRDGLSHRDVLRLAHQSAGGGARREALFRWIYGGIESLSQFRHVPKGKVVNGKFVPSGEFRDYSRCNVDDLPAIVRGFELIKKATTAKEAVELVAAYKLPHEAVPNEWKNNPAIWEAMLPSMGLTAMLRNLAKMTAVGLIAPLSIAQKFIAGSLTEMDRIRREKLHPIQILTGMKTYSQGHGDKGKLTWTPDRRIVDALDAAFYMGFDVTEPTGKNFLVGIDCSGSMSSAAAGSLTARDIAAAMAMIAVRVEKNSHVMGFTGNGLSFGNTTGIQDLPISPKMRLDSVIDVMSRVRWGTTDCSLPMVYAKRQKMEVDTFLVITDNETYAGAVQPAQALVDYRKSTGRKSKMIVLGVTATECSIADPNDAGMLDIAGFSTEVPALITDFSRD